MRPLFVFVSTARSVAVAVLAVGLLLTISAQAHAAITVTDVTPPVGSVLGGTAITITGSGFVAGATVKVGDVEATNVVVVNDTTITATTPASSVAGSASVVVTNADATTAKLPSYFVYGLAARYDLGTLGGTSSEARAVNASGQVVGVATTAGGDSHAFLWTAMDGMVDLETLGGASSDARAVNASGQVVGTSTDAMESTRAFSWTAAGGMIDLGGLGSGFSAAMAVNASGQVAGGSELVGGSHAFLWTAPGPMVDLGTLGGTFSTATAVNASGQVVGESATAAGEVHAFSWTAPGPMVDLGTFGGDVSSPVAVNASGQVVGFSTNAAGWPRAFSWTAAGGMIDIIAGQSDSVISFAYDVNDSGMVVGLDANGAFSWTAAGGLVYLPDEHNVANFPVAVNALGQVAGQGYFGQATFWTGGWIRLGTLGGFSSRANDVNDAGLAVGVSETLAGDQHAAAWLRLPGPTVTGIAPASGTGAGGTSVTITGTGFEPGASVLIGGVPATSVVVIGPTTVTATTPAGPDGPADVLVRNPELQGGILTNGFHYDGPTVADVLPPVGSVAGGTAVTISGTHFVGGTTATFGGVAATNVVVVNDATITATTPAHAAGAVAVTVTNPDGAMGTRHSAFVYGLMQRLDAGTLGGSFADVWAVNNGGQAVGYAETSGGPDHAFVWSAMDGMIDLGTLGGDFSVALDINASGKAVGYAVRSGGEGHAFSWTAVGGMVDLETLGGSESSARAVNASGLVVGSASVTGDSSSHAFSWTAPGPMADLETLGGDYSSAGAVNASGQIVGWADTADFTHAFVWTAPGPMVDLGTLGGDSSWAYSVNASGQVSGDAETAEHEEHAFVWTAPGPMVDLGTLGGGYSEENDLNDAGQVVGNSTTADDFDHAFSWTAAGGMIDLGTLGGDYSNAYAVNASGQVVGVAETADGEPHAFVWTAASGMVDLGTLSGSFGSGYFSVARDVNDSGLIVGQATTGLYSFGFGAPAGSLAAGQGEVLLGASGQVHLVAWLRPPAPTVTTIAPASGPTNGGTPVTIAGTGFMAGDGVQLGGVPASSVVVGGATTLTATTGAHAAGPVNVRVTNGNTLEIGTLLNAFTYVCPVIAVGPATLPDGAQGVGYAQALTASGGVAPRTFALAGGALPVGITLSSSGVLSGPPSQVGNFAFAVAATDANSCAQIQPFTLTIVCAISSCFSDEPLVADAIPIKAVHIMELRARIDYDLHRWGFAQTWSDPTIVPGVTLPRAQHLLELQTGVDLLYLITGDPRPVYSHPAVSGRPILALDLEEVRAALVAFEQGRGIVPPPFSQQTP